MTLETDRQRNKELKRIADALEAAIPLLEKIANPMISFGSPPPPPPAPVTGNGYWCTVCGTWVPTGMMHTCRQNICQTDPDMCSSTWKGPPVMVYNEGGDYHSERFMGGRTGSIGGLSRTITGITELS